MVKKAMVCDHKGDAAVLAKAAKIENRDIISHKSFHYDCKFDSGYQQRSIPSTLETLVSMLLNGADLND